MGWLKEKWNLVEELFYNERGPITTAKYYLYLYLVENMGVRELEPELIELERNLCDSSLAYLYWFIMTVLCHNIPYPREMIVQKEDIDDLKRCGIDVKVQPGTVLIGQVHPGIVTPDWYLMDVADLDWKKAQMLLKDKCVQYALKRIFYRHSPLLARYDLLFDLYITKYAVTGEEFFKRQVDLIDSRLPTLKDLIRYLAHVKPIAFSYKTRQDIPWIDTAYWIFENLSELSPRMIVDMFYGLEHASGQILVHVVIPIDTPEADEMLSILDYIRMGNVYALYDYLVRVRKIALPSIVRRYSMFLPGTKFKPLYEI